ncbi:hypothetical protein GQ568_03460 [Patescibacteria group bacterium]|nr:hypothetical protein [Patescibacteria group bacterium]
MASFTKFQSFIEKLAEKVHNLGSDQLVVALTNVAPTATDDVLVDLTEVAYTNISTRNIVTVSSAQTAGTYKLVLTDLVLTASGSVGPFRYIVIYNDTAGSDDLVCFFDYGSAITMENGDTFTVDFDAASGVLTLA